MPARTIEVLLLIAFIMEQLLRILACGIGLHAGAYVRDPWCLLDGAVITLATVAGANLTALRAVRDASPPQIERRASSHSAVHIPTPRSNHRHAANTR